MKTAETVIRQKRLALLKRMDETIKKYAELNDAEFILSTNIAEVRRIVAKYRDELSKPLFQFFLGDARSYSQIDKVVWDAQAEFDKALAQFQIKPKVARTDKLIAAVRAEYTNRVMGQISNTFRDIVTKSIQFKTLAEAHRLPLVSMDNLPRILRGVVVDGKAYDGRNVEKIWDMMTERYGRADSVKYYRYSDGSSFNFPMRSYIDMRTKTIAGEVARMVSAVEASANEIYTGKISRTGAIDSCKYWEGKIVFYSQVAKDTFLEKYPQHSEAKEWPTLQEVEKDRTHIFMPNCTHRVLPLPIDLMPEKTAKKFIEGNTLPKIPEKIREPRAA
jgi:cytochrome c556